MHPGIGFLAGFRGADGTKSLVGEPNPKQWDAYIANQAFFVHHLPEAHQWYRYANRGYLEFAKRSGFITDIEPIVLQLWSEPLQKFRLAGEGVYDGPRPRDPIDAHRLATYFDPLPYWHAPLEMERTDTDAFPLHAITQRPMVDVPLVGFAERVAAADPRRQCAVREHERPRREQGLDDGDWAWLESPHGRIRCRIRTMEGVEPSTVWTWNAVGKQAGAWGLAHDAPEATTGFLLNHLIAEHLPRRADEGDSSAHEFRSGHRPGRVVRRARPAREMRDAARPGPGRRSSRCRRCRRSRVASLGRALRRAMKLGLLIDLDTCVGCHACATACKEWNGASAISGPLTDCDPYGSDPSGAVVQPRSATTRSASIRRRRP